MSSAAVSGLRQRFIEDTAQLLRSCHPQCPNRDLAPPLPPVETTRPHRERAAGMTIGGKRIVLLGGTSGIGLATAQAAAREGASVVVASSRQPSVDRALATLPAGAEGYAADLTDAHAVPALFERIGPFDHLVFTAGEALKLGRLASTDPASARLGRVPRGEIRQPRHSPRRLDRVHLGYCRAAAAGGLGARCIHLLRGGDQPLPPATPQRSAERPDAVVARGRHRRGRNCAAASQTHWAPVH